MKIHMPSPTSAVGAIVYATFGAGIFSLGTMVLHHIHVFWH
jgi:hypothetical protein